MPRLAVVLPALFAFAAVLPAADDAADKAVLDPFIKALKPGNKLADRVRAAQELGKLGERAKPAARALCAAAIDESPKTSQAALESLEKVWPELHKQVVLL